MLTVFVRVHLRALLKALLGIYLSVTLPPSVRIDPNITLLLLKDTSPLIV